VTYYGSKVRLAPRACTLTPYARDELAAADLTDPGLDDLERARRFFVRSAQGFARVVRPGGVSWGSSAKRGASEAASARELVARMHAAAERLRRVVIDHADAAAVIAKYGLADAVIYCDPPYLAATRASLARSRGNDYAVDLAGEAEHRALAAVLRSTPAAVLLSGYPSGLYAELYGDWSRIQRVVARPSTSRGGRSGTPATEVIWSNRPLAGQLRLGHPAGEAPA